MNQADEARDEVAARLKQSLNRERERKRERRASSSLNNRNSNVISCDELAAIPYLLRKIHAVAGSDSLGDESEELDQHLICTNPVRFQRLSINPFLLMTERRNPPALFQINSIVLS